MGMDFNFKSNDPNIYHVSVSIFYVYQAINAGDIGIESNLFRISLEK